MAKFRKLFTPFTIKNLELKNRVVMPPMCQYSATDGVPNDWHFVHYTSRAIGGVGLIIVEMTNIAPNGRITPNCLGLWNDKQQAEFKRLVDSVHAQEQKSVFKSPTQDVKLKTNQMQLHLQPFIMVN